MTYDEKLKRLNDIMRVQNTVAFDCSKSRIISIEEIAGYDTEETRQFGNKVLDRVIHVPDPHRHIRTELLMFVEAVLGRERDLFKYF